MSRFFNSSEMQKAGSNFERALIKLQSEKPKIGEDTREWMHLLFFRIIAIIFYFVNI